MKPAAPAKITKTIDLVDIAIQGGDSTREIARKLGMNSNALHVAKSRGRLSPTATGTLAAHLGKDPITLIALAALEAEPPSHQRDTLLRRVLGQMTNS